MNPNIRAVEVADAAALARIYEPYVTDTPITFEETPPTATEFAERIASIVPKYPFLVAQTDENVIGYAYASAHRPRVSYRWSVDVAVYIDPQYHRRGVGVMLYEKLLPILTEQGFAMAYAGITLPNAASVGLHRRIGFRDVGVYRNVGYKLGQWLDVIWLERRLCTELPDPPAEPRPWR
jgi:phosphinothricin acetyltransferase